jgi:hypothetical protein
MIPIILRMVPLSYGCGCCQSHFIQLIKFQQAGNKLYQLYQRLLCQKSDVFDTMLSLPQPGQMELVSGNYKEFKENALRLNLDGSSDEKALLLPHSADEFDHLLSFIHPPKCVFKRKCKDKLMGIQDGLLNFQPLIDLLQF